VTLAAPTPASEHAVATPQLVAEIVPLTTRSDSLDTTDVFMTRHHRKTGGLPFSKIGVNVGGTATGQLHPQQHRARRRVGYRELLDAEGAEWLVENDRAAAWHA